MKQILLIFLLSLLSPDTTGIRILDDMSPRVRVHQSERIEALLRQRSGNDHATQVKMQGFRVQIFSSNSAQTGKTEAQELEKRLLDSDLHASVYVKYQAPFWKVRVGDCLSRDEALKLREDILRLMPDLSTDIYIVRDEIIVEKHKHE